MRGTARPSTAPGGRRASRVAPVLRTTTSATLLLTVAVSALTGCVTVERPPAPWASVAPARPPVPGAGGRAAPRIVQAPAREALERVSPSRAAKPGPPATRSPSAPVPRGGGQPDRAQRPPHTRSAYPGYRPPTGLPALPDHVREDVRGETDVCELGDKYGGWRQGSPESAICRQAQRR